MCIIYGKIIGEKNPVFVECNSERDITLSGPLIATFDHEDNSYIILNTGTDITGFRCNYANEGIYLYVHLSYEESKVVRLALGIIVASLIYQEEYRVFQKVSYETYSKLKDFTSVAFEVMRCKEKDFDIIAEISRRSGVDIDEVVHILLELSNIPIDTNFSGGN